MDNVDRSFDACFHKLLGHEGGFTLNQSDPGNWTKGQVGAGMLKGTKFGISAAAYPDEDIALLSVERAKHLMRRDYWGPAGCDTVPDTLRFDLFDMAVNSGVKTAIRLLQKTVGETQDGILGPRTLQAVQSMDQKRLRARFNAHRLEFLTTLPTWVAFGKGWARRIAANLKEI